MADGCILVFREHTGEPMGNATNRLLPLAGFHVSLDDIL